MNSTAFRFRQASADGRVRVVAIGVLLADCAIQLGDGVLHPAITGHLTTDGLLLGLRAARVGCARAPSTFRLPEAVFVVRADVALGHVAISFSTGSLPDSTVLSEGTEIGAHKRLSGGKGSSCSGDLGSDEVERGLFRGQSRVRGEHHAHVAQLIESDSVKDGDNSAAGKEDCKLLFGNPFGGDAPEKRGRNQHNSDSRAS